MTTDRHAPDVAAILKEASSFWVFCLCAQWCGICRDYEVAFLALAVKYPNLRLVVLDVEDEWVSAALGDLEIETFPTIVSGTAVKQLFNGPVLPQIGVLERMLLEWQLTDTSQIFELPTDKNLIPALQKAITD